jgi:hypothetical protein
MSSSSRFCSRPRCSPARPPAPDSAPARRLPRAQDARGLRLHRPTVGRTAAGHSPRAAGLDRGARQRPPDRELSVSSVGPLEPSSITSTGSPHSPQRLTRWTKSRGTDVENRAPQWPHTTIVIGPSSTTHTHTHTHTNIRASLSPLTRVCKRHCCLTTRDRRRRRRAPRRSYRDRDQTTLLSSCKPRTFCNRTDGSSRRPVCPMSRMPRPSPSVTIGSCVAVLNEGAQRSAPVDHCSSSDWPSLAFRSSVDPRAGPRLHACTRHGSARPSMVRPGACRRLLN